MVQLEVDVNTSSAISIAPTLFDIGLSGVSAFSSERPTCHALSPGKRLPSVCVFLAGATNATRQTRRAGHGEIAPGGTTPRSVCLVAHTFLGQTDASAVCLPSALPGAPRFLTLTARPGASIGCHKRSSIYFVSSHGTPRLCQSKEYAWNLPLQLCPCPASPSPQRDGVLTTFGPHHTRSYRGWTSVMMPQACISFCIGVQRPGRHTADVPSRRVLDESPNSPADRSQLRSNLEAWSD